MKRKEPTGDKITEKCHEHQPLQLNTNTAGKEKNKSCICIIGIITLNKKFDNKKILSSIQQKF